MDLDAYLSVTHDNTNFSKACSLVKTDQMAYVETELLHQSNISIHYCKGNWKLDLAKLARGPKINIL